MTKAAKKRTAARAATPSSNRPKSVKAGQKRNALRWSDPAQSNRLQ
jgi:hypothetical protein